ncbi:MAG: TatD family hydrolase, partial [Desulfobulbales bacterium]
MKKSKIPLPQLAPENSLIDTHCHLDMDAYAADLDTIVHSAAEHGVRKIITIGIDAVSSHDAVALAKRFPNIWATLGIHPHNAAVAEPEVFERFSGLAEKRTNKVVGYGEIGLDFAKNYAPRDVQMKVFATQLGVAKELGLPVIIHDRQAHEAIFGILNDNSPFPAGGVMHCFSGDSQLARQLIDLGFFISIPGIVTFNKSDTLQKVAREIPLDKMILETDGPFL